MSDQRKNTLSVDTLWNKHLAAAFEDRFRDWAFELVTHERWNRAVRNLNAGPFHEDPKWRRERLLGVVWEFAGDYTSLLERAVIESCRELRVVVQHPKITLSVRGRQRVIDSIFRFVQRFTVGGYERPWEGSFMLSQADSQGTPGKRTLTVDFQRANVLVRLFQEAEEKTSRETVTGIVSREIETGTWKDRARQKANTELLLATAGYEVTAKTELEDREMKIWNVIQGGARGLQYCRELDAAKIGPPRRGIWKDGPRTYVAGYVSSDKRLAHWIQDEKSKVRRKAELQNSLASKSIGTTKPA